MVTVLQQASLYTTRPAFVLGPDALRAHRHGTTSQRIGQKRTGRFRRSPALFNTPFLTEILYGKCHKNCSI